MVFDIKLSRPEFPMKVFVVIPGSDAKAWNRLKKFESWVNKKTQNMQLISLYSDCMKRGNYFGYSIAWSQLTTEKT